MIFPEASKVICYDLQTITRLSSGSRNQHSEFKAVCNNFWVIWDKVALDESGIVHRVTQNTRNTVLPDMEETLRNKGYSKSQNAQVDESLLEICRYQQNVPQRFYVLDTLVI